MKITRRTLCYTAATSLIILAPAIEGALPLSLFWLCCLVAVGLAGYAFIGANVRAQKLTLIVASVALTVTFADLVLRFTPIVFDDLVERWPRMPLVNRYEPNLHYEGRRFNDLSRMAGVKEWREEKPVKLDTDEAGFRNESRDQARPLDVLILGDSFGAGGVSQEYTWSSILARNYHLNTCNLSVPASSPWQEYVNFRAEADRLKPRAGTVLIWQLFTGNDLDEYYGSMDINALPWCGRLRAWLNRFNAERARSPIHYLITSIRAKHDARADVMAKDFLNGRKLLFYKPYTETSFRTPEQISAHPHYVALQATIHAMKELTTARGIKLCVVLVPAKEEVYSWVWQSQPPWSADPAPTGFSFVLARLCAEEGISFLDLKPQLIKESRRTYEETGQLLYWYDDTHLNTTGNLFTAALLHDELLR